MARIRLKWHVTLTPKLCYFASESGISQLNAYSRDNAIVCLALWILKRKLEEAANMFQCIIQQRNGWIHAPNPETRDVFPGNCQLTTTNAPPRHYMIFLNYFHSLDKCFIYTFFHLQIMWITICDTTTKYATQFVKFRCTVLNTMKHRLKLTGDDKTAIDFPWTVYHFLGSDVFPTFCRCCCCCYCFMFAFRHIPNCVQVSYSAQVHHSVDHQWVIANKSILLSVWGPVRNGRFWENRPPVCSMHINHFRS